MPKLTEKPSDEFLEDEAQATLTCPDCGKDDRLWSGVVGEIEGFRTVTVEKTENGPVMKYSSWADFQFGEIENVRETTTMGCGHCAWLGDEDDLVYDAPTLLGWDGKPRKRIPRNQMSLYETT